MAAIKYCDVSSISTYENRIAKYKRYRRNVCSGSSSAERQSNVTKQKLLNIVECLSFYFHTTFPIARCDCQIVFVLFVLHWFGTVPMRVHCIDWIAIRVRRERTDIFQSQTRSISTFSLFFLFHFACQFMRLTFSLQTFSNLDHEHLDRVICLIHCHCRTGIFGLAQRLSSILIRNVFFCLCAQHRRSIRYALKLYIDSNCAALWLHTESLMFIYLSICVNQTNIHERFVCIRRWAVDLAAAFINYLNRIHMRNCSYIATEYSNFHIHANTRVLLLVYWLSQ